MKLYILYILVDAETNCAYGDQCIKLTKQIGIIILFLSPPQEFIILNLTAAPCWSSGACCQYPNGWLGMEKTNEFDSEVWLYKEKKTYEFPTGRGLLLR